MASLAPLHTLLAESGPLPRGILRGAGVAVSQSEPPPRPPVIGAPLAALLGVVRVTGAMTGAPPSVRHAKPSAWSPGKAGRQLFLRDSPVLRVAAAARELATLPGLETPIEITAQWVLSLAALLVDVVTTDKSLKQLRAPTTPPLPHATLPVELLPLVAEWAEDLDASAAKGAIAELWESPPPAPGATDALAEVLRQYPSPADALRRGFEASASATLFPGTDAGAFAAAREREGLSPQWARKVAELAKENGEGLRALAPRTHAALALARLISLAAHTRDAGGETIRIVGLARAALHPTYSDDETFFGWRAPLVETIAGSGDPGPALGPFSLAPGVGPLPPKEAAGSPTPLRVLAAVASPRSGTDTVDLPQQDGSPRADLIGPPRAGDGQSFVHGVSEILAAVALDVAPATPRAAPGALARIITQLASAYGGGAMDSAATIWAEKLTSTTTDLELCSVLSKANAIYGVQSATGEASPAAEAGMRAAVLWVALRKGWPMLHGPNALRDRAAEMMGIDVRAEEAGLQEA